MGGDFSCSPMAMLALIPILLLSHHAGPSFPMVFAVVGSRYRGGLEELCVVVERGVHRRNRECPSEGGTAEVSECSVQRAGVGAPTLYQNRERNNSPHRRDFLFFRPVEGSSCEFWEVSFLLKAISFLSLPAGTTTTLDQGKESATYFILPWVADPLLFISFPSFGR